MCEAYVHGVPVAEDLLTMLQQRLACPALSYAEEPRRLGGGFYTENHVFRRLADDGGPNGSWREYSWVGKVEPGEPVRIFLPAVDAGRRAQAVTTSPVEAILTPA